MKTIYNHEYELLIQLLKKQRVESGLTQSELAMLLGVDQTFVSKYEQAQRRLDVIELRNICNALGTNLSVFLTRFESLLDEKEAL